ncbi:IS982 family transposase [Actinopolyspora mortivallis]|uniref:IS982 family transposase n=1 Tax=Actinopolyspora mortivallis TaxID=33906 RepID=UPI000368DA83|nr:IS982 family transposase [Actinopolyspora mortivallis]
MKNDSDTLLTALYCVVDDALDQPCRPGRPKRLSDAELVTLAVAQVLLEPPSETAWLRYARKHLAEMFPSLPGQSRWNKRLRAAGVIARVLRALAAATPIGMSALQLTDPTPVPFGTSRETVQRSELTGTAGYSYCVSHTRFFWGLRLYLMTTAEGMPMTWCLTHPTLGEREIMAALLDINHPLFTAGQVSLVDKGFSGHEFDALVADLGARLVTPPRSSKADPHPAPGPLVRRLVRVRQWIESIFDTLKGQLCLERHGARTEIGLYTRVEQRLLALAAAIWHNTHTGQPHRRSLIAYDH